MVRRSLLALLVFLAASIAILLVPGGTALSQTLQEVYVTNFPKVQEVDGSVSVVGPVHLAQAVRFLDVTVPPVPREHTTRLVEVGSLVVEGFPRVVLSLHGVVKGTVQRTGAVGVLLVPEEKSIREAYDEQGLMHFHLEAVAGGLDGDTSYFASNQPRFDVAFARYRVLMYNTTDKSVSANLFAYLTN
jgi:hypothetical protein